MDSFISRKKRKLSRPPLHDGTRPLKGVPDVAFDKTEDEDDDTDTDTKIAILASLHPELDSSVLFEALISADGSVAIASRNLTGSDAPAASTSPPLPPLAHQPPIKPRVIGLQTSLPFGAPSASLSSGAAPRLQPLTRKGRTLHLYTPASIAQHTPCSLVPNFLPADLADRLLAELLAEARTYSRATFKLFDNVVTSPHSACFYVSTEYERARQLGFATAAAATATANADADANDADKSDQASRQQHPYLYNGSVLDDVRTLTPVMSQVQGAVRAAVNAEVEKRVRERYPGARKLRFQSPAEWTPNAAFVNCYDGGKESVGYHSDQLTYLGPRPVIGSISLGVAREFRVRRIVPKDEDGGDEGDGDGGGGDDNGAGGKTRESKPGAGGGNGNGSGNGSSNGSAGTTGQKRTQADEQGQIAIHLPHNSLLVMHAEMQEEWKHSIAPAAAIDPHPVAGAKRINITYRSYREHLHPALTPRCRCGVATVLRCVQRSRENRGRYMWQCHAGNAPGKEGCNFFQWAEFDDDGNPPWSKDFKGVMRDRTGR